MRLVIMLTLTFVMAANQGQAGEGSSNPEIARTMSALNGLQTTYLLWTEQRFREFLLRDNLRVLTEQTRGELTLLWLGKLTSAAERKWEGYTDKNFGDYAALDYETFEAINCLGAMRCPEAVKSLTAIATARFPKDNRERWMAVRALGLIGDKSCIPDLVPLIYHYNANTRFWAQISLVRLSGVNFGYDWEQWAAWYNTQPGMRQAGKDRTDWQLSPDTPPEERKKLIDPKWQIEDDLTFIKDVATGNARVMFN